MKLRWRETGTLYLAKLGQLSDLAKPSLKIERAAGIAQLEGLRVQSLVHIHTKNMMARFYPRSIRLEMVCLKFMC